MLLRLCGFASTIVVNVITHTRQSEEVKNASQLELWGISVFITVLLKIHILYQGW